MKRVLIELTGYKKFKFLVDADQVELHNKREEINRRRYEILNRESVKKSRTGDKELYNDLVNQLKQVEAEIRNNVDIVWN
jgi:predicted phage-related endonuclease